MLLLLGGHEAREFLEPILDDHNLWTLMVEDDPGLR